MIDEDAMDAELLPHRTWYTEQLTIEEQRWADDLSALISRVEKQLPGRGVTKGWINTIRDEQHPLTQEHFARVADLQNEFLKRSQPIWDKYLKETV